MARVKVPQWGRPDKFYWVDDSSASSVGAVPAAPAIVSPVTTPLTPPRMIVDLASNYVINKTLDYISDTATYSKTRSQYVDNGLAVLPTLRLNKLFNDSFEINSVTPTGTACNQVGQMPSDGWTITQSDTDPVTGKPYWSVSTVAYAGVNGGTCLAFAPTPGTSLPNDNGSGSAYMILQSIPMAASMAILVVSNWIHTTSAMTDGTTFPNNIYLHNLTVPMGIVNPQDTSGSIYFNKYSVFEGGNSSNPVVWTQVNQLDTKNNNTISINEPLFKITITVRFANTGTTFTMPSVGNLLFVDDVIAQYPIVSTDLPSGTGTVTSVGMSAPAGLFTVTGTPLTTSGTLGLAYVNQTANTFLAGPLTGTAAAPTFRALASTDLINATANDTVHVNGVLSTAISPIGALMPAQAGADVTSTHTAAFIAGQGALATQSTVDLAGAQILNKTLANIGDTATRFAAVQANADHTASNTAAAIAGQGALATQSTVDLAGSQILNKTLDNIGDGSTYARARSTGLSGGFVNRFGLVENLQAGQNFLFNPTGALGLQGWVAAVYAGAGTLEADPFSGGRFVLIVTAAATNAIISQQLPAGVTINAGIYTISALVEVDSLTLGTGNGIGVDVWDATAGVTLGAQWLTGNGVINFTTTAPSGGSHAIYVRLRANCDASSAYIYRVKCEQGSTATAYRDDYGSALVTQTHNSTGGVGLDGLVDGPTYARPLATALTSGSVDLSLAGVINKTLANIGDANGRFAIINGPGLNAVSSVDPNNRALIDFTQSGHLNKTLDNVGDGSTYARIAALDSTPVSGVNRIKLVVMAQNAGLFFAGPASGAAAAPNFRALVATDIPQPFSTLTNQTANRVLGTTYTNGGTTTMSVSATLQALITGIDNYTALVNGVTVAISSSSGINSYDNLLFFVPAGQTYSISASASTTLTSWFEYT